MYLENTLLVKPCKNRHIAERWNYNGQCVECKRGTDRTSSLKAGKRYRIKRDYGLTIEEVNNTKEAQQNKCAICDEEFLDEYKVQIDHCHATGKVRGLLCIMCNWLLGNSKDNAHILRQAANYLEEKNR